MQEGPNQAKAQINTFVFLLLVTLSAQLTDNQLNMEHLRQTFTLCQQQGRPALVTYVTAGFPTVEETPAVMLGLEAGGAGESVLPILMNWPFE